MPNVYHNVKSYKLLSLNINWLSNKILYESNRCSWSKRSYFSSNAATSQPSKSNPDSIISNQGLILFSRSWYLLCYFLSIKQQLFITFYSQINSQTKWQKQANRSMSPSFLSKLSRITKLFLIAGLIYIISRMLYIFQVEPRLLSLNVL